MTPRSDVRARLRTSRLFWWLLIIVTGMMFLSFVTMIVMAVAIPHPTPSQAQTQGTVRQAFFLTLSGLVGLLTGKLS